MRDSRWSVKDNTVEIIREYVDADSRFRYVSEPDKGIYDAFNKDGRWREANGFII